MAGTSQRQQTSLTLESPPILEGRIGLGGGATGIVAMPAMRRSRHAVQFAQPLTQDRFVSSGASALSSAP